MKGKPLLLATVALTLAGCGSSQATITSKPTGFSVLIGKRVPGTSSDWLAIASPFNHPVNIATTVTPPIETDNGGIDSISFFDFRSSIDAAAFYMNPPIDAHLIDIGILAYRPLSGDTGVPQPSRGLDERECLWAGGPGQGGSGRGAVAGPNDKMDASGKCNVGTPSSIGVATIVQSGDIVILVQASDNTVVGGSGNPADLMQNAKYALNSLQLLHSLGLS